MVEWNGIFRLFRFSGILGQAREVHPKFRNEIPENDCSIRSPTRNFRNFWSNGKRPRFLSRSFDFTLSESPLTLGLLRNEVNGLLERERSRNGGMGGGSVYQGIFSKRDF